MQKFIKENVFIQNQYMTTTSSKPTTHWILF